MKLALVLVLVVACAPAAPVVVEAPPSKIDSLPPSEPVREKYDQSTALAALRSFVRAYDNKRWDILTRFAPNAHKEGITAEKIESSWGSEEMAAPIRSIKAALDRGGNVTESNGRALFAYADGTVTLLEEDGVWKIENFE